MSDLKEQKCPSCGGAMRYDPAQGKLVCDFCGSVVDIGMLPKGTAAEEEALGGFDFDAISDQFISENAEALPVYTCVSCGADLIVPAEQSALTCPYCGNNIVLSNQVTGQLRPDGVIPFRIQSKDLPEAVNRYYKDKKLLPKDFFSESTMGRVTGVYVPFWVFSGDLYGEMTYSGERSSSHRSGDYIITETRHYSLARSASLAFDALPVDTSGRIDDRLMDSLEPFDLSEMKPFDIRYLAGFTADRFDQKKSDIAGRAEGRMRNTAESLVSSQAGAGYVNVSRTRGGLNADLSARYVLFPVYMFDIDYGRKTYHFAVNGQTGKVVGELPVSKSVSAGYFLKRTGIVAGVLIAFSLAKYFLGF